MFKTWSNAGIVVEDQICFHIQRIFFQVGSTGSELISFTKNNRLSEAAHDCGRSRLYSTLHFELAVLQGKTVAHGAGMAAYGTVDARREEKFLSTSIGFYKINRLDLSRSLF